MTNTSSNKGLITETVTAVTGDKPWATICVSVALRLLYHLYQGPMGVLGIIPIGLLFAFWFAKMGRLWPVIVAHGLMDLIGLLAYSRM